MKKYFILLIAVLLFASCANKKKVQFFDGSKALVIDRDNVYSVGDTVTAIYSPYFDSYEVSTFKHNDTISSTCDTISGTFKVICTTLIYRNGVVLED